MIILFSRAESNITGTLTGTLPVLQGDVDGSYLPYIEGNSPILQGDVDGSHLPYIEGNSPILQGDVDGSHLIYGDLDASFGDFVETGVTKIVAQIGLEGLAFSLDGLKFYTLDTGLDRVYQYDVAVAWDITTISYTGTSLDISAPGSFPEDLRFKPDGTKLYVLESYQNTVLEYDLLIPWDISSATINGNVFNFSAYEISPAAITFSTDGSRLYIVGSIEDKLQEFGLSVPWDVTTASFRASKDISSEEPSSRAIAISSNGLEIFIGGAEIHRYVLSVPWDLTSASYADSLDPVLTTWIDGLFLKGTDDTLFIAGALNDTIVELARNTSLPILIGDTFIGNGPEMSGELPTIADSLEDNPITATSNALFLEDELPVLAGELIPGGKLLSDDLPLFELTLTGSVPSVGTIADDLPVYSGDLYAGANLVSPTPILSGDISVIVPSVGRINELSTLPILTGNGEASVPLTGTLGSDLSSIASFMAGYQNPSGTIRGSLSAPLGEINGVTSINGTLETGLLTLPLLASSMTGFQNPSGTMTGLLDALSGNIQGLTGVNGTLETGLHNLPISFGYMAGQHPSGALAGPLCALSGGISGLTNVLGILETDIPVVASFMAGFQSPKGTMTGSLGVLSGKIGSITSMSSTMETGLRPLPILSGHGSGQHSSIGNITGSLITLSGHLQGAGEYNYGYLPDAGDYNYGNSQNADEYESGILRHIRGQIR